MPSTTPVYVSQTSPIHTSQTPSPAPRVYTPPHLMMVVVYWLMSTASFLGLVEISVLSCVILCLYYLIIANENDIMYVMEEKEKRVTSLNTYTRVIILEHLEQQEHVDIVNNTFFTQGSYYHQDVGSLLKIEKTSPLYIFVLLGAIPRKEYGDKNLSFKVFEDRDIDQFEALVLRNSGNEWFGLNSESGVLFRDMLMTHIAYKNNVDVQAGRPVVVYINGQYWGIHNLREMIKDKWVFEEDNKTNKFRWKWKNI